MDPKSGRSSSASRRRCATSAPAATSSGPTAAEPASRARAAARSNSPNTRLADASNPLPAAVRRIPLRRLSNSETPRPSSNARIRRLTADAVIWACPAASRMLPCSATNNARSSARKSIPPGRRCDVRCDDESRATTRCPSHPPTAVLVICGIRNAMTKMSKSRRTSPIAPWVARHTADASLVRSLNGAECRVLGCVPLAFSNESFPH